MFFRLAAAACAAAPLLAGAMSDGAAAYPAHLRWIWFPEGQPARNAPQGARYFRASVTLPPDTAVSCAHFIVNADDTCTPFVNGLSLIHI